MGDPVDEFLRRHGLPAATRAELAALLGARTNATLVVDEDDAPAPSPIPNRYEDLGVLGAGGTAVVHRVRDSALDRVLAMKVAQEGLSPAATARFVREARLTASLDHGGVVPVHELGFTDDGRPYFTMREVRGTTLTRKIREVHAASDGERFGTTADDWSLFRLLDALRRVAETVAWAHRRGVVHRDLKPDNVMVGDDGEVLVLDWGIARAVDETATGVAGTPAYMAPEQARGEAAAPRTDVFALGATLAEILTGGPPRSGPTTEQVLGEARTEALSLAGLPRRVPDELVRLVHAAVAPDPAARPDAAGFAHGLRRWQEGAGRRERAAGLVAAAAALAAEAEPREQRIEVLRARIAEAEATLRTWDPVEVRRPVWALQDELEAAVGEQALAEVRATELLRAALEQDPDARAARSALAARYQREHARAEAAGDRGAAARAELLLRAHDDGQWAAWLSGEAHLDLRSEPPGAEVTAYRYEERDRRRVPVRYGALGRTPVTTALPPGSWRLDLAHPERAGVRVPVWLPRSASVAPPPVGLPLPGDLGPDDVLVPAGPFRAGGDPRAPGGEVERTVDLPAFVVRRYPVTNAEYLAFLDDLAARGSLAEAEARAPRLAGDPTPPVRWTGDAFALVPDAQGDVWAPDWPVFGVSGEDALAYAAWLAARTGRPWRLGTPEEWEKAARGVDGRRYPWGDVGVPIWSANRQAQPGRPFPRPVTAYPEDESPYGVRGMGGNAATCTTADGRWWAQGASWSYAVESARSAARIEISADRRTAQVGIRLFRSA